jgi:hypothetical protein
MLLLLLLLPLLQKTSRRGRRACCQTRSCSARRCARSPALKPTYQAHICCCAAGVGEATFVLLHTSQQSPPFAQKNFFPVL